MSKRSGLSVLPLFGVWQWTYQTMEMPISSFSKYSVSDELALLSYYQKREVGYFPTSLSVLFGDFHALNLFFSWGDTKRFLSGVGHKSWFSSGGFMQFFRFNHVYLN